MTGGYLPVQPGQQRFQLLGCDEKFDRLAFISNTSHQITHAFQRQICRRALVRTKIGSLERSASKASLSSSDSTSADCAFSNSLSMYIFLISHFPSDPD
jgi:hypothetical protein